MAVLSYFNTLTCKSFVSIQLHKIWPRLQRWWPHPTILPRSWAKQRNIFIFISFLPPQKNKIKNVATWFISQGAVLSFLLFFSRQSQETSSWRNSPNQTLPHRVRVCLWFYRAAPRKDKTKTGRSIAWFSIVNSLQFASEVHTNKKKSDTWERKLTACAPDMKMATERHKSSSLQSAEITVSFKVPVVSFCSKSHSHILFTSDSSVLCCVVLSWCHSCGPRTSVPRCCSTCRDAPTAWLTDLNHTKAPRSINHDQWFSTLHMNVV